LSLQAETGNNGAGYMNATRVTAGSSVGQGGQRGTLLAASAGYAIRCGCRLSTRSMRCLHLFAGMIEKGCARTIKRPVQERLHVLCGGPYLFMWITLKRCGPAAVVPISAADISFGLQQPMHSILRAKQS